jgi:hypothetical protein
LFRNVAARDHVAGVSWIRADGGGGWLLLGLVSERREGILASDVIDEIIKV